MKEKKTKNKNKKSKKLWFYSYHGYNKNGMLTVHGHGTVVKSKLSTLMTDLLKECQDLGKDVENVHLLSVNRL